MQCRVVKGGWFWMNVERNVGDILENVSPEWVANRVADGGLVEPIEEAVIVPPRIPLPVAPETATVAPPETADLPKARGRAKPSR